MARFRARQAWTAPHWRWPDRVGKLAAEMGVADPAFLEEDLFAQNGRAKRLNALFGGETAELLGDTSAAVWKPVA